MSFICSNSALSVKLTVKISSIFVATLENKYFMHTALISGRFSQGFEFSMYILELI